MWLKIDARERAREPSCVALFQSAAPRFPAPAQRASARPTRSRPRGNFGVRLYVGYELISERLRF